MKKGSFEGWYFKQNTNEGDYAIAFIPGHSIDSDGKAHAFIQINHTYKETNKKNSHYLYFPIEEFELKKNPLEIRVGDNFFSLNQIAINIDAEDLNLHGNLKFGNITSYKRTPYSPSIMGPFGYLPFLECYHEVYSVGHSTSGSLNVNNEKYDFENGNGYIEGDKGKSFPKRWIWFQANHFDNQLDVSIMCAIADVPILPAISKSITGLICILSYQGTEYRFATYNGSKVELIESYFEKDNEVVTIILAKGLTMLKIIIQSGHGAELKAPLQGAMERTLKENLDATIEFELSIESKIIHFGKGINCGFEKNW